MTEQKLSRSLSPLSVWSLALGSIIGWGAFVMPGNLFLESAGPLGTAIGLGIGAVIMIIISLSYGYMIQRYPVAGGEFAYTYKSYGKHHAFVCAWFLGLSYLSIVPLNATALALISRYMFPGILQHGYLYTIAGWDVYLGEVILASFALIFLGLLAFEV
jgi:amino acid transporter